MSETPERKVLKETISKLKAKNITSVSNYKANIQLLFADFKKGLESFKESAQLERTDKQKSALMYVVLGALSNEFQKLFNNSIELIDNMQLYIDVLESYAVELDNTLKAIFEQAKKHAEEKNKEQQTLMKKPDTAYVK